MHLLLCVEVPDYDVSLETHESCLTWNQKVDAMQLFLSVKSQIMIVASKSMKVV